VNPAIYYPIEATDEMRQSFGVLPSEFVVSYVGNIGTMQDLSPLIEYARGHQNDGTIILIAGNGSREEKYRSMAEGLANVRFLGYVTREETTKINAISDVCTVLLADHVRETSFPCKLCTLMAMRKPILLACRADSTLRDYFQRENIGLSAAITDADAFAAALDTLRDHPEMRAAFGQNAYEAAMRDYSLSAIAEKYEVLL
ncbi:MAG: glycosyltransferase, partial [Oscillospiraceae bacterium]|nr:glycosyltransferase [Oscillospiraceae bacterium]